MLSKAWNWVKNQEPVAVAAFVIAAAGVVGQAVSELPSEAGWAAVGSAVVTALLRFVVTPAGKTSG